MIVFFPGSGPVDLSEVGGKAYSLIGMINQGLPVPAGIVLTTRFFEPWFDAAKATSTWRTLGDADPERWPELCADLKAFCASLAPTEDQRQILEECRNALSTYGDGALFAVRSSSPEEDRSAASFAGGYETVLGVRLPNLESAARRCFASTLDERVLVYKAANGFEVRSPRTAVIVQQQVPSEIAGVAFSLNPLTNDYDEAVIDSNWGLGESVVGGAVSPDHFVVDKVTRAVVERRMGAKQVSTWLGPKGGTVDRRHHRSTEWTLEDDQIRELTAVVCRIEDIYGQPTDVEWAYAGGRLHVLQARPITAYVPLPEEMLTRPGEPRRLYSDGALADGVTINAPISPMGMSWLEDLSSAIITRYAGNVQFDATPDGGLVFAAGGRFYTNLSNAMWLWKPEALARRSEGLSAVAHQIITNIDVARYRAPTRPSWGGWWTFRLVPMVLWRMRQFVGNSLWAIVAPRRARRAFQQTVEAYERWVMRGIDYTLSLPEFRRQYTAPAARHVADITLPPLVAFISAMAWIDGLVRREPPEVKALAEKLKLGFPDNVVVEMGSALFRLAKLIEREDFGDLTRLAERIDRRQMAPAVLEAWERFVSRFGCRGPLEMDVASPRYGDSFGLALRQMSFMTVDDVAFDPEIGQGHRVEERRRAYEALMSRFGWFRRAVLRRAHTIVDLFAGTRDTPKYHMVLYNYAVRRRALIEGQRLAALGRLDAAEHVFDLSFTDLEAAAANPSMDLREVRATRTRFFNKLKAQVRRFPPVIDSRGRILRPPPRPEKAGELSGMAVSPGIVTGPVKLLHNPHEKPVNKGDVLVAYTTDPGWTPLFVNAAAIVLEVGGMLQHGAVVAREYGKPCVAGIDGVMTKLQDAQQVEVDGTTGVIRLLS